jgi:hypothetical protein
MPSAIAWTTMSKWSWPTWLSISSCMATGPRSCPSRPNRRLHGAPVRRPWEAICAEGHGRAVTVDTAHR